MEIEQRGQPVRSRAVSQPVDGRNSRVKAKPFNIPKQIVFEAFKRVKANKGGYGVDAQSLSDFEKDLDNNLYNYKLWNRMSSGSYHPPPVMRVEIEKPDGGVRPLGIPTVTDRIAQMVVCHCFSEREAKALKALLDDRFNQCGLTLHPVKTKIAYCKGGRNKGPYETVSFDFLGYTFRPRWIKTRRGKQGLYFLAAVSQKSAKRIRQEINRWPWRYWRQKELTDIRRYCQNRLNGWMNYYGLFGKSIIRNVLFHFDKRLSRWGKVKYKKLRTLMQAPRRINRASRRNPSWFPHWSGN